MVGNRRDPGLIQGYNVVPGSLFLYLYFEHPQQRRRQFNTLHLHFLSARQQVWLVPSGDDIKFESRRPRLFAMAFSIHQQATQEITLPVLRAHFCDANAAEFDLNKRFLNILEELIDSLTLDNMEEFLRLFQNYFYETIDVG
jgi:hypothetical protein